MSIMNESLCENCLVLNRCSVFPRFNNSSAVQYITVLRFKKWKKLSKMFIILLFFQLRFEVTTDQFTLFIFVMTDWLIDWRLNWIRKNPLGKIWLKAALNRILLPNSLCKTFYQFHSYLSYKAELKIHPKIKIFIFVLKIKLSIHLIFFLFFIFILKYEEKKLYFFRLKNLKKISKVNSKQKIDSELIIW